MQDETISVCVNCSGKIPPLPPGKKRNRFLTVLFSFLFCGWGHWYCGKTREGLTFFGVAYGSLLLMMVCFSFLFNYQYYAAAIPAPFLFFASIGTWLYGMIDAYKTADRINKGEENFSKKSRLFWLPLLVPVIIAIAAVFPYLMTFVQSLHPDIKFYNEHKDLYIGKTVTLLGSVVRIGSGGYTINDTIDEMNINTERNDLSLPEKGTLLRTTGFVNETETSCGGGWSGPGPMVQNGYLPGGASYPRMYVPPGSHPLPGGMCRVITFYEQKREVMTLPETWSGEYNIFYKGRYCDFNYKGQLVWKIFSTQGKSVSGYSYLTGIEYRFPGSCELDRVNKASGTIQGNFNGESFEGIMDWTTDSLDYHTGIISAKADGEKISGQILSTDNRGLFGTFTITKSSFGSGGPFQSTESAPAPSASIRQGNNY